MSGERWGLFWTQRAQSTGDAPWSFAGSSYFAVIDASNRMIVGPTEIGAWQDRLVSSLRVAESDTGLLAVAYRSQKEDLRDDKRGTLLIDADGELRGEQEYPYTTEILALKSTSDGDFIMLLEKQWADIRVIRSARLSSTNELRVHSEPVAESRRLGPVGVVDLIPLDDGYLATWELHDAPLPSPSTTYASGTRIQFRKLDAEGRPLGGVLPLLPESEAPFQIKLRWARFEDQLGLLWVESDLGYEAVNWDDHVWSDEDRFRFALVSTRSFARSDVIEISKASGVEEPGLFVDDQESSAGTIWIEARVPSPPPGDGVHTSEPIAIDCAPCRARACGGSPGLPAPQPNPPPEEFAPAPLPAADPAYVCEASGGRRLEPEPWPPSEWPSVPEIYDQAWPARRAVPENFPIELDEQVAAFSMVAVPASTSAAFWQYGIGAPRGPAPGTWYFAVVDADDHVLTGPREAWYGSAPAQIAVSEAGQLAVACEVADEDGVMTTATLLMDSRGERITQVIHAGVSRVAALASAGAEGFVMLMMRRSQPSPQQPWPTLTTLTFATLSARHGFREQREPVLEQQRVEQVFGLASVENGYVIAWEEASEDSSNTSLRFLRLDARGRASGEVVDLLPAAGAAFQRQLSFVRFAAALGVLWVVADERYSGPGEYESGWPRASERYRFMLLSARDLTPRSELLELARGDEVGDPELFLADGALTLFAHVGERSSNEPTYVAHLPTTPVVISCAAE